MISYSQAIEKIESVSHICKPGIESVELTDSLNRIISKPVSANINVPSFDNSGLDGFAFRYKDGGNTRFFNSTIKAGDSPSKKSLAAGEAVEIMTGAPLPKGADTVIAIEQTRVDGNTVHFLTEPKTGQAVRKKGTDFKKGQKYLSKGTGIEPKHILSLAALGVEKINVFKKLKVNLISTGNEIATANADLKPGENYNSTMPLLKTLAQKDGVDLDYNGTIGDDQNRFKNVVNKILSQNTDILITTGAVSMGTEDFVPRIFVECGIKKLFHRVAIKPGKPIWCGYKGNTLVIGLPGNPLSTYIGWEFFIKHYIHSVYSLQEVTHKHFPLLNRVSKPEQLRCFYKATLEDSGVRILEGQESYRILPLLQSNVFAVLPESQSVINEGDMVEVKHL